MKRLLARASRAWRVGRRFTPELRPERFRLLLAAALLLAVVVLELMRPWPLQWLVDDVLLPAASAGGAVAAQGTLETIVLVALATALVLSARTLCDYAATLCLTSIGHTVARALRLRIFRHLVHLSPSFHARHKSGDLLMRLMGDVPLVKDMLVDGSVQLGVRCLQVAGTVVFLLLLDVRLTLVALGPAPLLLLAVRFFSERLRVAVQKQRRKEGDLADHLHEAVSATLLVQSLGREAHVVRRFARSNRRSARAGLKAARAAARLAASVELLLSVGFAVALAYGAQRVLSGALSTGELLVFISYVRSLSKPVRSAGRSQARIAKGTASGERILSVLDRPLEVHVLSGDLRAPSQPRELRFEGVGYRYGDGTRALDGVDVTFRAGELVALVGPNGAGKSTLSMLAVRVEDPERGRILLDGRPLPEYELGSLRDRFGLALQQNVLLGETIAENLLLGKPDATEDELWAALAECGVDDVVRELPDGLETVLGTAGVGLSGGQARRLCLARALLRRAPVLIADEPFSGLDARAAEVVAATLRRYATHHIVLVVTHGMEELGRFDRVVRLERGRIVDDRATEAPPSAGASVDPAGATEGVGR